MHTRNFTLASIGEAGDRPATLGRAVADWLFTSNGADHAYGALGRAAAAEPGADDAGAWTRLILYGTHNYT